MAMVKMFNALSNPDNRRILRFLQANMLVKFTELKKHFNLSSSSLSNSLKSLLNANLITKTPDGRYQLSYAGSKAVELIKRLEDLSTYPMQIDEKHAPIYELILSFDFERGSDSTAEEREISRVLNEAFLRFISKRPVHSIGSFVELRFKKIKKRTFRKYLRKFTKSELIDYYEDERLIYLRNEKCLNKIPSKVLERCERTKWFELKESLKVPLIPQEIGFPYILIKYSISETKFDVHLTFKDTFMIFGSMSDKILNILPFQLLRSVGLSLGYEFVFYVYEITKKLELNQVRAEYDWGVGRTKYQFVDVEHINCPYEEINAAWLLSQKIAFFGMRIGKNWVPAFHATPLLEKMRFIRHLGFEGRDLIFPVQKKYLRKKLNEIKDPQELFDVFEETLLPSLAIKIMCLLRNEKPELFNNIRKFLSLEEMLSKKLRLTPIGLDTETLNHMIKVIEKTFQEYEAFETTKKKIEATVKLARIIYPFVCESFIGNPKDWIKLTASTAYHYLALAEEVTIEEILKMDLTKLKNFIEKKIDTFHTYDEVYEPCYIIDKPFFKLESMPLCDIYEIEHEALQRYEDEWNSLKSSIISLLENGPKDVTFLQEKLKLSQERDYWLTHLLLQLLIEDRITCVVRNSGRLLISIAKPRKIRVKYPRLYQFVGPFWSNIQGIYPLEL